MLRRDQRNLPTLNPKQISMMRDLVSVQDKSCDGSVLPG